MKFTLLTPFIVAFAGSLALANPLPQNGPTPSCEPVCTTKCSGPVSPDGTCSKGLIATCSCAPGCGDC
ncbi:hypothetical protein LZ30DRAFT_697621 [Colletotrichum cereale]|nr:hypothetical protein LZ30DRAFT_697621 [Colletotrichum cereale]